MDVRPRAHRADPPGPVADLLPASDWCQRWQSGAPSWRHRSEGGFDSARYTVEPVAEAVAADFVRTHHYARSFPAALSRYGLFDGVDGLPRLVGVAVFGVPVSAAVLRNALPTLEPYVQSQELSRFVLLDECPANTESWFLARCLDGSYSAGVRGVVSFADPSPRATVDGRVITPGHVGTIYQASNAVYTGRGTPRSLVLLPDGTVLNARSAQKVRAQEQGHDYVEQRLMALGAAAPRAGQSPTAWLTQALTDVGARRLRHRGAHRYVFRLGRSRRERERVTLGQAVAGPYPKTIDAAV